MHVEFQLVNAAEHNLRVEIVGIPIRITQQFIEMFGTQWIAVACLDKSFFVPVLTLLIRVFVSQFQLRKHLARIVKAYGNGIPSEPRTAKHVIDKIPIQVRRFYYARRLKQLHVCLIQAMTNFKWKIA